MAESRYCIFTCPGCGATKGSRVCAVWARRLPAVKAAWAVVESAESSPIYTATVDIADAPPNPDYEVMETRTLWSAPENWLIVSSERVAVAVCSEACRVSGLTACAAVAIECAGLAEESPYWPADKE